MSDRNTDNWSSRQWTIDLPLRAACIHGRYDEHAFLANPDHPESSIAYRDCSGGRVVTINYKAAVAKLMAWDAYRDGRRGWPFGDDLVRVGEVPAIHAILDAAIGDTDIDRAVVRQTGPTSREW